MGKRTDWLQSTAPPGRQHRRSKKSATAPSANSGARRLSALIGIEHCSISDTWRRSDTRPRPRRFDRRPLRRLNPIIAARVDGNRLCHPPPISRRTLRDLRFAAETMRCKHGPCRFARQGRLLLAWRPGSESNRRTRLCRPLHDHSATWPAASASLASMRSATMRVRLRGRMRWTSGPTDASSNSSGSSSR